MTQQKEIRILQIAAVVSFLMAVLFFVLTLVRQDPNSIWEPLFVLALGLVAQCAMRLILTSRLRYDHDRLFVTTDGWFQKNKLDKAILKRDPVQKWADLTTYDPEAFQPGPGERELVVQHTCTNELMNEVNAVLAFLPLVLAVAADRKLVALIVLLVLSIAFSALAAVLSERARQFRFLVKAGRV